LNEEDQEKNIPQNVDKIFQGELSWDPVISQTSTPNVKNSPNWRTNAFMLIYGQPASFVDH